MYWAPLFHEIFQKDRKTLKITKYISHHSDVNNWSYLLKIFLMSIFLKVFIDFFTILLALCFAGWLVFAWKHVGSQLPHQESNPLHWNTWPLGKSLVFCLFVCFFKENITYPAKLPSSCSLQSYFPPHSPPCSIFPCPPPRRGHPNPSSIFTLPIHVLILLLALMYTHESINNLARMYI